MTPLSFQLTAASLATQAKSLLYRLHAERKNPAPSRAERGGTLTTHEVGTPITDRSYWEGRYVLCSLTLRRADGRQMTIPDAVCSLTRQRNIVTTAMVGMDGTIKEYINEGDYQINLLLGIAAMQGGVQVDEYPEAELRELRLLLDEKAALDVHSEFLAIFDIDHIVIKDYTVEQSTESNYQMVSISAVSDEVYNLLSTEY